MSRRTTVILAILASSPLLAPSLATADWKQRAIRCVSDLTNTQGGDVATSLQRQQNAHARYCEACRGGADQYDSVLACHRGADEKSTAARAEIETAGRDAVNAFLASRINACCKEAAGD